MSLPQAKSGRIQTQVLSDLLNKPDTVTNEDAKVSPR